jgi:hypothetical protein
MMSASCDKGPTNPSPPIINPPVQNASPVIVSLSVDVPLERLEVDRDVAVAADVRDAETASSALTYVWTASAGTIAGAGPTATWRLPKGSTTTPATVTIGLQVVERYANYDAAGQAITSENRVSATGAPFVVHDSVAEISTIAVRFLKDLFGNSSVSPEACLVDFWDGCGGKAAELSDIKTNRQLFVVLSAEARIENVSFRNPNFADIAAFCRWHDRVIQNGATGVTQGGCVLTAVYQNDRWWLCDSSFNPEIGFRVCDDGTKSCIPPAPFGPSFSLKRYVSDFGVRLPPVGDPALPLLTTCRASG